jgi:DNA mismatch repair ATPase MutS
MPKNKNNNNEAILEQLFEDGYASKEIELIPNKLSAIIKNLSSIDQISIEKEMCEVKGSGPFIIHTYGLKLISATLVKYGANEFKSREEAAAFINRTGLSSVLVDKIVKLQNMFEKEVREALNMDEIDKVFFDQASQHVGRKQSQEGSTPGSEAA